MRQSIFGFPPTLLVLCSGIGFGTMNLAMLTMAIPLFSVELGASAAVVGLLLAVMNVLPVTLGMSIGDFVDRSGYGRVLIIGTLGLVFTPLAIVLLPTIAIIAVTQVLRGFFHLLVTVGSQSFVASLGEDESHERNFSLYSTMLSGGQLFGPVVAGLVIDGFGYRAAFLAMSMVAAIPFLVVMRLALTSQFSDTSGGRTFVPSGRLELASRNVGVQLAVLASSAILGAAAVRQGFLPVYLSELDFSATTIGLLLSARALASVVVRPLMPAAVRAFGGRARALVSTMVVVALGIALTGFVSSFWALALFSLLVGLGTGVGMPLSIVSVASHVPPSDRGFALGLRLAVNRLAQLISPVSIGFLIGWGGFAFSFAAVGAVLLSLSVIAVGRVGTFEREEAERANTGSTLDSRPVR